MLNTILHLTYTVRFNVTYISVIRMIKYCIMCNVQLIYFQFFAVICEQFEKKKQYF